MNIMFICVELIDVIVCEVGLIWQEFLYLFDCMLEIISENLE